MAIKIFLHILNLIKFIKSIINYLLSAPFCFYCKNYLYKYTALCDNCFSLIKPVVSCDIIIKNLNISVFAVSDYKDPLKSMILAKTYCDRSASVLLAQIMFKNTVINNLDFDYLIPIPLHFSRELRRGYNQAEVIAQELAFLSKKTMIKCIKRTKKTKFQSGLSGSEREQNVKDVFEMIDMGIDFENKTVVLVDDLMTTGATIKNCAKVLSKFKLKKIYAIIACRVCS